MYVCENLAKIHTHIHPRTAFNIIISSSSIMISAVIIMCFCFITITQQVHSKVVTVNNIGSNSTTCCMKGSCLCNSLYDALQSIDNNTIINITSDSVLLEAYAYSRLEHLYNITITGNDIMVMCNNKGSMFWRSCDNILIKGITWDQCGIPSYPTLPAIRFQDVFHLSIIKCVFQHFKVCQAISLFSPEIQGISVHVENSSFMFNKVEDASVCSNGQGTIIIRDYYDLQLSTKLTKNVEIIISRSIFYCNGYQDYPQKRRLILGALVCTLIHPLVLNTTIEHSYFSSNELVGMSFYTIANSSYMTLNNVTVFNNSQGGVKIYTAAPDSSRMILNIKSSHFIENNNGALLLSINKNAVVNFKENSFVRNIGSQDLQGTALYIKAQVNNTINLFHCNFDSNTALGGYSIVYIAADEGASIVKPDVVVLVKSSLFVNNQIGSALHISYLILTFDSYTLFQNNSAETGAAINVGRNSTITAIGDSILRFVNNSASLRGGAIYSDLSDCLNNGILFSDLSNLSSVVFINNTATISGNSIYLNIPTSCNAERDHTKNNSVAYVLYKFQYMQSYNTIGSAISTSPYRINLCSQHNCGFVDETCLITGKKMLGQSIYFNATVCDYFNTVAETVQF